MLLSIALYLFMRGKVNAWAILTPIPTYIIGPLLTPDLTYGKRLLKINIISRAIIA
jgi:hypothetical protein